MDIRITPRKLTGSIPAIPSKSHAHRLILASALSGADVKLRPGAISRDIAATLSCVREMGARVEQSAGLIRIGEIDRKLTSVRLNADESGSTARFLLPIAAALYENAELIGSGSLLARPFSELTCALRSHGVFVSSDTLPITTRGRLLHGRFEIAGNISSQFITGLLFALPLLLGDSEIVLTAPPESRGYVEMTLRALRLYGITVEQTKRGFIVPGNQKYSAPKAPVSCEGDWSNAAVWLAAGVLGERVSVSGLDVSSAQGDREIITLLNRFGAETTWANDTFTARPAALRAIEIDARDIPDLVPILAVSACAADGVTVIRGAERLRIKESDRLEAIKSVLNGLGGDVKVTPDGLLIHGVGRLRGGSVSGHGDHRIVMAASLASVISDGAVTIHGAEAVSKSYPGFFDDLCLLGGSVEVL